MPEGDTIHRAATALKTALLGKPMHAFEAPRHGGRLPTVGASIERVESRGKHLEIGWDDGIVLHTHMGMSGSWHLYRTGERWRAGRSHARVVIDVEGFQAVCFDEEFAELAGVPVERVWLVLLALAALAIVTLIRVVGAILVIALLTLPAAMARHWASDLRRMMALAVTLSAACTAGGLFLAWGLADGWGVSLPPGPLIVLLAAAAYAASAGLRAGLSRRFTPA